MKAEFQDEELGNCLTTIIDHRGKTPKKLGSDWMDFGVPAISAMNVNSGRLVAKESIRYVNDQVYRRWMSSGDVVRGDCLLVSEGATLGECMYWDNDYPIVLSQRLFCLRANVEKLYPKYLYAFMTSRSFQEEVIARATGTSVPGLRQTEVLKLKIRLMPMAVQKTIGDTIYSLNTKIELNRKMSETLEQMARAIFKSWFIDFDPVHAKRQGKKPFGMDDATAALFPDSFEQSELGDIPKGWRVVTVGEAYDFAYGKALKAEDRVPGNVVVMGSNGPIGFHGTHLVKGPGVVIGRKGNPGVIKYVVDNFFPIDTAFYLSTKIPEVGEAHYFSSLVLEVLNLGSLGADSAVPGLNRNLAYMSKFCLPKHHIISAFNQAVESLLSLKSCNEVESETLANTRDLLLPRLLAGKISIKEVS